MTIPGTVINGVIVLDPPQQLPDGTRVEVAVSRPASESSVPKTSLGERLLELAGMIDDLPVDMARNHDHYIHGTPRK